MKKTFLNFFILCFCALQSFAQQNNLRDRQDLKDLLEQRVQKFSDYTGSLEKRSGIFGNKTKRDILSSNEVLIEIVKTDNRIISVLNRVIDFRNFEKINMNYNLQHNDEHLENLLHATDTLGKQVTVLKSNNISLTKKTHRLQWLVFLLIVALVVVTVKMLRRKFVVNG